MAQKPKTETNKEQATAKTDAPEQETLQAQQVGEGGEEKAADGDGIRARRAFMLKFFLPNNDGDWINKNVVAKGKGTQVIVGRVVGGCTGTEEKNNVLPDGSLSRSVVLFGQFEYESTLTGEIGQASSCYLPMAFADQVRAAFAADPAMKMVEVDIDIGLEATGKTIPYEWLVINHAGGVSSLIQRLRARRRPGEKAIAAPAATPALAAPAAQSAE